MTLVVATGVALGAFLFVASELIRTGLKRRKADADEGRISPSRLLNDLQPVEELLVDFVSQTRELASVLAALSSFDRPVSFARIVHEGRTPRGGDDRAVLGLEGWPSNRDRKGVAMLPASPGSARVYACWSRCSTATNFPGRDDPELTRSVPLQRLRKVRDGGTPSPARRMRALPGDRICGGAPDRPTEIYLIFSINRTRPVVS